MSSPSPAAVRGLSRARPRGVVRDRLVAAAIDLARTGGPDAVLLREATRRVGVAASAAYRHFSDRDALLYAVCVAAMRMLAERMEQQVGAIQPGADCAAAARAHLAAIGSAYLDFAADEPGLFRTAFAVPDHLGYETNADAASGTGRTPFQLLGDALDDQVEAGILPPGRRPAAQFIAWSAVHGYAVLRQDGPLRDLSGEDAARIRAELIDAVQRAVD